MIHFDQKPVIVSPWNPDLPLHKADVQNAAVWVQLHDLPLKYRNPEVLGRLVSQLGIPLMLDPLTQQRDRGKFVRILVNVEIKNKAKQLVFYRNELGRLISQKVVYEWEPVKCTKCGGYGHETEQCRKGKDRKEWRPKPKTPEMTNPNEPVADKETAAPETAAPEVPVGVPKMHNQGVEGYRTTTTKEDILESQTAELISNVPLLKEGEIAVVLPIDIRSTSSANPMLLNTEKIQQSGSRVTGKSPDSEHCSDNG